MYVQNFNVFARLLSKFFTNYTSTDIENFKSSNEDFIKNTLRLYKERLPDMYDDKKGLSCNDSSLLALQDVCNELIEEGNLKKILLFAQFIDIAVGYSDVFSSLGIVLNDNYDETHVEVVRNVHCKWEHIGGGNDDVFGIFKNILVYNNKDIYPYKIKHVHYSPKSLQNKHKLKIGYANIANCEFLNFSFYENGEEKLFSPSIIEEKKPSIKEIVNGIMDKAIKEKVDILVFVEMLGFDELIDEIKDILCSRKYEDTPIMTICPSVCKDYGNKVYILDDVGNELGVQYKNHSFIYGKDSGYKEDINHNGFHDILVIHVDGLGRITFPVCKDFLNERYRDILIKKIRSTLIICPSYSYATTDFLKATGEAYSTNCAVIWNNACTAVKYSYEHKDRSDNKKIGSFLLCYEGKEHYFKKNYVKGDCLTKECRGCCLKCLYMPFE